MFRQDLQTVLFILCYFVPVVYFDQNRTLNNKMTYRPFRRQGNLNNTTVSQLTKCIKIMTFWEVCFEIRS